MKRSTGTHVYSFAKCQRLAALDLTLSRSERRDPTPWEAFAAKRGRDFEDDYVADLEEMSQFYQDILKLKPGYRPPFSGSPGEWLYDESGHPVVHLSTTSAGASSALASPIRMDMCGATFKNALLFLRSTEVFLLR